MPQTRPLEYSATGWTLNDFQENGEPAAWGYVHSHWGGKAAVGFLDGRCAPLGMDDLRDMTRWSNMAAKDGNPNWRAL